MFHHLSVEDEDVVNGCWKRETGRRKLKAFAEPHLLHGVEPDAIFNAVLHAGMLLSFVVVHLGDED
jgi:hypothetical protein